MSKKPDPLGDRMKEHEMVEAGRAAMPGFPLLTRLDGRAFHTFTRGFSRPYDSRMSGAMEGTTIELVREFKPSIGYTQSDEITLLFPRPEVLFGGRFQKLTSVLAGYASSVFAWKIRAAFCVSAPDLPALYPCFDCRVWQVPDAKTVLEVFCWREDDATKNSVIAAAAAHYSHKQLMNKGRAEQMDMLHAKGINWNDYPVFFKRGSYFQRQNVEKILTPEELERIPSKHRPASGTKVTRTEIHRLDIPPIHKMPEAHALQLLFPKKEESGAE